MTKIAVLSSVYGSYDQIQSPPEQDIDAEWIMVTDNPDIAGAPWRVVVENRTYMHPRLASRVPKASPWLYTDADIVIWIDGNIIPISEHFIGWAIESLGDAQICQFQQFNRATIVDEIRASRHISKWVNEPFEQQLDYYVSKGYQIDYGVWWCGLMIKSKSCPKFGDEWMTEMVRWGCQDQIAYSYLMHAYGIRPKEPIQPAEGTIYNLSLHKGVQAWAPDQEAANVWANYVNNLGSK